MHSKIRLPTDLYFLEIFYITARATIFQRIMLQKLLQRIFILHLFVYSIDLFPAPVFCRTVNSFFFHSAARTLYNFFYFIKLFRCKTGLGNGNIFLGKTEIGELVIANSDHIADFIPVVIRI